MIGMLSRMRASRILSIMLATMAAARTAETATTQSLKPKPAASSITVDAKIQLARPGGRCCDLPCNRDTRFTPEKTPARLG